MSEQGVTLTPELKTKLAIEVATMRIAGASIQAISKELGISRHSVNALCKTDIYKSVFDEIREHAVKTAKGVAVNRLSALVDKAVEVVEQNLDDGKLEAAKLVFEAIGVKQQEEQKSDTTINLIVPGQKQEQVIEVNQDGTPTER